MKILLTGANGFLGKYVNDYFLNQKIEVVKIGKSNQNDIICDFSIEVPTLPISTFNLVVHLAGKAHCMPVNKEQTQAFYDVNVLGTKNLLESIENLPSKPEAFVYMSTVAVYGLQNGVNINELTPLDAKDAYGHSKSLAEKMIEDWCRRNNIICTILRPPLIIGSKPLGNFKSMVEGIKKGYYVNIGKGETKKSMVLARDIAKFIQIIFPIGGIYNVTDGCHPSFFDFSNHIAKITQSRRPKSISPELALILAKLGDLIGGRFPFNSDKLLKIMSDLTFDDSKARKVGWKSTPVVKEFNIL